MQNKFYTIIFCKNEDKFNDVMRPFNYDNPLVCKKHVTEDYYEYEHFRIMRFKHMPIQSIRGHKCDLVIVEKDLYANEEQCHNFENYIVSSMLVPQRFEIEVQYI